MLATKHCGHSTGISAHLSSRAWRSSPRFRDRLSILTIVWPNFIPNMFYGVAVWRCCRLHYLGDVALLKEIKDYPSMLRCGVIVLVAVVIPKKLPGTNSTKVFLKKTFRPHQWGICRGAQEVIWHLCEKLPRHVTNHHQLGPYKPGTFVGSAHQVNNIP